MTACVFLRLLFLSYTFITHYIHRIASGTYSLLHILKDIIILSFYLIGEVPNITIVTYKNDIVAFRRLAIATKLRKQ